MNAMNSNLYISTFKNVCQGKRIQSKEQNLIWNLSFSLAAVAAASHMTSFSFLIYKMWIITYLTDVCEKLFEGPCLIKHRVNHPHS